MIVAVFDYLKLSEYKKPDTTDLTVAGHPAVKTPTTIIYVARGTNPDARWSRRRLLRRTARRRRRTPISPAEEALLEQVRCAPRSPAR